MEGKCRFAFLLYGKTLFPFFADASTCVTLRLMKYWSVPSVCRWFLPTFFALAISALADDRPVYVIPIRDEIESSIVYVVRRGVSEAVDHNACAIILDMNTHGGRGDSMEEIMDLMGGFKGDTITFVNNKAYSAGAFIAVSTKSIYMAPSSVIGAAAPVLMSSMGDVQQMPSSYQKKISSAFSARIRAAAQKNGYNAEVVDAMVRETDGLKIDGKVIVKKGEILTLSDTEATAKYGRPPKHLLAEGVVKNLDELLAKRGYNPSQVRYVKATGAEKLARWITMISPFLLLVGLAGIYLEFKTPGVSLPGILGGISLAIFFFGHYVAGLSGWEEVILFSLGLVFIAVEIFILPGYMISGFLGLLAIGLALVWAMTVKIPGIPIWQSLPALQLPIIKLAGAMLGAVMVATFLARWLPKSRGPWSRLISKTEMDSKQGYTTAPTRSELLGKRGVTLSMLRPSGTARFGEETVDVITEGDFISARQTVVVRAVRGAQVIVSKA